MSAEPHDPEPDARHGAARIVARAAGADARDDRRLGVAIDDVFLPEDGRLDDETRAAIGGLIGAIVRAVEGEMIAFSTRATGAPVVGEILSRLVDSGLMRDHALMAELVARARQDMLATALDHSVARAEQSGLLARLTECPDGVIASAASALLIAENRRRSATASRSDLPAALHHRVVWWVAAALREGNAASAAFDRVLAEAAARSLAAHDEGDRVEAAATRLAAAVDARDGELGTLLVDSLTDARPALFIALLAHAEGLDYPEARAIVADADGDRLWLALRAQGLDRPTIARIGLHLAEADRRRDIEAFADALDAIVAIEADAATRAIAPMRLHPDFRAAVRALARSART